MSRAEVDGGIPVNGGPSVLNLVGRFGWGVGDQLLSSVTNFLLGVLVARAVTPADFGAFSLGYATFTLSLGAVRAIGGQLLVVRHSAVPVGEWSRGVKAAAGTALMGGVIVGAGCLLAGAVLGGTLGGALVVLGFALPGLLIQDVWRFAFFARGKGKLAFLNDTVWAVSMLGTFGLITRADLSSVAWFTAAWASAGWLAAVVGLLQLRVVPGTPMTAIRWLRENNDLAPRFFAEFGISSGVTNLTVFGMGRVMGLAELGRLRAGLIALGPLNILLAGAGLVGTPEGVRLLRESPKKLVTACRWLSLGLALSAVAWGVVVITLPSSVGNFFLGANWQEARPLLLPLSIGAAGYGFAFGAWPGLRALAAAKRSLRARSIDALATLSISLGGAALGGSRGAAWGYAIAGCLRVPTAWYQFMRAFREHMRQRAAEQDLSVRGAVGDDPQNVAGAENV